MTSSKMVLLNLLCMILFLNLTEKGFAQSRFYSYDSIQEIKITFKENNWDSILDSLFINYGENGYLKGDISINGTRLKNVGVRFKGFSSWNEKQKKNPFHINLSYVIPNQNYNGYTKIKLSNVISDPSFVREVLSYEIARKYMPAGNANFANVYVNDTIIGLYTNVESVDNRFLKTYFGSDGNAFFKGSPEHLEYPFGQNSNLAYTHGTDSSQYIPYYSLESEYGWNDLFNFINLLNNDTSKIETVLNVDRALWMHAFNYSMINLDSYIGYSQNYYLYLDDNGQFNTIPWDLNMSFGSFRNSDDISLNLTIPKIKILNPLQHLYFSAYTPRPLMKNLFSNPQWRKMYLAHLRTIMKENFSNNLYYTRAQEIQSVIDLSVQQDSNKFYTYANFLSNLTLTVNSGSSQFPGLQDLMNARIAYLDTFPGIPGEPVITNNNCYPLLPEKGKTISIKTTVQKASEVYLAYRFNSRDLFAMIKMNDDGQNGDSVANDHIYTASLNFSGNIMQYYIYAENDSTGSFSPERAAYEFYTIYPKITSKNLVINELMTFPYVDSKGNNHNSDWIELHNNTHESIRLLNLKLYSGYNNEFIWNIPDTTLADDAYFIIWADGDTMYENHATFSLNAKGGRVFLAYSPAEILDSLVFGEQPSEKSIGRFPNGYGSFCYLTPTFASYNSYTSTAISNITIYPNPASDFLNVEVRDQITPLIIEIYNSFGQRISSFQYEVEKTYSSPENKRISLNAYGSGIYFVKIIHGNKMEVKKLLINR